jgi:hypothetical protein
MSGIFVQHQLVIATSSILILPLAFTSCSLLHSTSRHLLTNHQRRPLVAEVGHVTEHLPRLRSQCFLEVRDAFEIQSGLDSEGGFGTRVGRADELQDGVAFEVVGAELLLYHGHVGLEVVVHIKGCIGLIGVEDCDLDVGHDGWC